MAQNIDELQIEIESDATGALDGLENLAKSLEKLKGAVKNAENTAKGLKTLIPALKSLGKLGQLNLNFGPQLASVSAGISSLSTASKSLNNVNFDQFRGNVTALQTALQPLQGFKTQASNLLNALRGFPETARELNEFTNFDTFKTQLGHLKDALEQLNGVNGKLGATIDALTRVNQAANSLKAINFDTFAGQTEKLKDALGKLSEVHTTLGSTLNGLSRVGTVADELSATMQKNTLRKDIEDLGKALSGLSDIEKSNLGSVVYQLKQIPKITESLDAATIERFKSAIDALVKALAPLAKQMESVAYGFSLLPKRMRSAVSAANKASGAFKSTRGSLNKFSTSITRSITRLTVLGFAFRRVYTMFGDWFNESNDYIENMNLFRVTMGDAADSALEFAEHVQDVMGIDISEWIQNQGIFMQLASGFGVASDQAQVMSQNLTQLAYDMASFFNTDVETAMQKLQSGMSGQIKGLKAFGINLSVAALQETALSLGIEKSVRSMSEAEKAQLRYITVMQRAKKITGDMARTLPTPANSLRILSAQFTQLKRALGDIVSVIATQVIPYVQALVQVLTEAANKLADTLGFELPKIEPPDVDGIYSGVDEELEDTLDKTEELKRQLMGFDELNILKSNDSDDNAGLSNDLGIELPEYDFLGELEKVDLGPIKEQLEDILWYASAIGVAIAGWKVAKFVSALNPASGSLSTMLGTALALGGALLEAKGLTTVFTKGLDGQSFTEILTGGGMLTAGAALIGKTFGSTVIGAAIGGIVAGVPMFIAGIFDSLKNGIDWLSASLTAVGATAAGAGIGAIIGMVGGPIGAGIGALIGLAIGLLTDLTIWVVQNWESIASFFTNLGESIAGFFSGLWEDISGVWGSVAEWFDTTVIQPLVNFFAPIVEWISTFFEGCWIIVQAVWVVASEWFNTNVIQPVVGFFEGLWTTVSGFFSQLWADICATWAPVFQWFDTNIIQPLVSVWQTATSKIGEFFAGLWSGIKAGIAAPLNAIIGAIESVINWVVGGINDLVAGFNKVVQWAADVIGEDWGGLELIHTVSFGRINAFAGGGFPSTGSMFIANEAGPELVGRIGNKTAVANNDQITAGIASAVYSAMMAAQEDGNNSSGGGSTARIVVQIGERAVGEAAVEFINGQIRQTGANPIYI